MATPKVTVIIPTYNRAGYLGDAVQSVLNQDFADLEVLVIDDGSTDRTADLLRAICDQRVRYIHQPHRGISAAMNQGLLAARGEYVARLDSDDVWLPDALSTLMPVLDARRDVGVVYAKGQVMDAAGQTMAHIMGRPERFPGDSLRSLVYDDCTCNGLARRVCFDRVGSYDETLIANEDWDMWLRMACYYRFCFVDKVVVRVRWHRDNFTAPHSSRFAAVLGTRTAPLDRLFSNPDLPAAVRSMKSIAYTNVYLFRGQRWLQVGNFKQALREFVRAVRESGQPLTTSVRVVWLAIVVPVLSRSAAGRRAVEALAALRRRRRTRHELQGTDQQPSLSRSMPDQSDSS